MIYFETRGVLLDLNFNKDRVKMAGYFTTYNHRQRL